MPIENRKVAISIYIDINDAVYLDQERGETSMSAHLRKIVESYVENQKDLQNSNCDDPAKLVSFVESTTVSC
ncbi:hypothetical protein DU40_13595 [Methanosarcina mazei]|uniref:Uncharacterized protein n=1 Tax=Methanosarcina mazei TaxID=2209 RepID=A0A0F8ECY6_METMZ|nr:hypothetical protein DU40_13595 [Methanosarcina mazei]